MQKVQTMQRVLQEEPLYTVKPRGGHKVRESASTILRDPNLEATSLILQELENEHEFLCVPPLPIRPQTLSFTCSLQRCIVPSYSAVGTVPCYCAPFKDSMRAIQCLPGAFELGSHLAHKMQCGMPEPQVASTATLSSHGHSSAVLKALNMEVSRTHIADS